MSEGARCREICEDCFKRFSPIEEVTVGGMIGPHMRACATCLKLVPVPLHHVHLDGLPTQEYVDLGKQLMSLLHQQAGWKRVTFEILPNGEVGFHGGSDVT